MENAMLVLKPGTRAVERDGKTGLALGERMRLTGDPWQVFLLRTLSAGPQSLNSLRALLQKESGSPGGDPYSALALVEFILNFEEYLEP
jgi:hypothetical protein